MAESFYGVFKYTFQENYHTDDQKIAKHVERAVFLGFSGFSMGNQATFDRIRATVFLIIRMG